MTCRYFIHSLKANLSSSHEDRTSPQQGAQGRESVDWYRSPNQLTFIGKSQFVKVSLFLTCYFNYVYECLFLCVRGVYVIP